MNGIRDVVREEQPRERLLLEGAGSLSNRASRSITQNRF